jgi:hypothetical protein
VSLSAKLSMVGIRFHPETVPSGLKVVRPKETA